jgi:hypothetical protein
MYLGFTTKGRLVAVLIIPSLGFPNWSVIYIYQHRTINKFTGAVAREHGRRSSHVNYAPAKHQQVFWRHCRGGRRLLQGESLTRNLYFVIVLLYFIFACIVLSKIQKILVPL